MTVEFKTRFVTGCQTSTGSAIKVACNSGKEKLENGNCATSQFQRGRLIFFTQAPILEKGGSEGHTSQRSILAPTGLPTTLVTATPNNLSQILKPPKLKEVYNNEVEFHRTDPHPTNHFPYTHQKKKHLPTGQTENMTTKNRVNQTRKLIHCRNICESVMANAGHHKILSRKSVWPRTHTYTQQKNKHEHTHTCIRFKQHCYTPTAVNRNKQDDTKCTLMPMYAKVHTRISNALQHMIIHIKIYISGWKIPCLRFIPKITPINHLIVKHMDTVPDTQWEERQVF